MTARDVLREIAADMKSDAHAFYQQPFNGRTVGEALGNLGAAVAALADVVASLLPPDPRPEPERDPVPYLDYLPELSDGEGPDVCPRCLGDCVCDIHPDVIASAKAV